MSNSIVPYATIVENTCGHSLHYYPHAHLNVYSFLSFTNKITKFLKSIVYVIINSKSEANSDVL